VEVLETEDVLSGPLPVRIPESLRPSDEDMCPSPTSYDDNLKLMPADMIPMVGDLLDDQDCWSQDDDDIITVRAQSGCCPYSTTKPPILSKVRPRFPMFDAKRMQVSMMQVCMM